MYAEKLNEVNIDNNYYKTKQWQIELWHCLYK